MNSIATYYSDKESPEEKVYDLINDAFSILNDCIESQFLITFDWILNLYHNLISLILNHGDMYVFDRMVEILKNHTIDYVDVNNIKTNLSYLLIDIE